MKKKQQAEVLKEKSSSKSKGKIWIVAVLSVSAAAIIGGIAIAYAFKPPAPSWRNEVNNAVESNPTQDPSYTMINDRENGITITGNNVSLVDSNGVAITSDTNDNGYGYSVNYINASSEILEYGYDETSDIVFSYNENTGYNLENTIIYIDVSLLPHDSVAIVWDELETEVLPTIEGLTHDDVLFNNVILVTSDITVPVYIYTEDDVYVNNSFIQAYWAGGSIFAPEADGVDDTQETWVFNYSTAWITDEYQVIDTLNYLPEYIEGESGIEINNSHSMRINIVNQVITTPASSMWVYEVTNVQWSATKEYISLVTESNWVI